MYVTSIITVLTGKEQTGGNECNWLIKGFILNIEKVCNINKNNTKTNRRWGNAQEEGHGLGGPSPVGGYLDQGDRCTGVFKGKVTEPHS